MELIFIKIGLKNKVIFAKKIFFSSAGGSDPHTLCLQWLGACPQTPIASGGWGICPQTPQCLPHRRFLTTRLHEEKVTACCYRPPFVLAFGFKYAWNVWRRRCSHSQTEYNMAKSISPNNTYTEKLFQKIFSSAPMPLWL